MRLSRIYPRRALGDGAFIFEQGIMLVFSNTDQLDITTH